MQTLPRRAQILIAAICLLGSLAALAAPFLPKPTDRAAPWELVLFLALGILAGRTKVRLTLRQTIEDGSSLSLSFALIFAALLRLGAGPAMLISVLSTLFSCVYPKRQPIHQILFNLGLSAFTTYVASRVFLWITGDMYTADRFPLFTAVMVSCLCFFLINSLTVASAIALSTGSRMTQIWRESFLWTAPSYFAAASAGTIAILVLGRQVGTVLLFVTPVSALSYLAYALSRRRTEENQQRIQELQAQEAKLAADLQREHLIAEALQWSLLSKPAEDAFPGLLVHTEYEPAWNEALVGGDFYDALALSGHKVALVVGDVIGKGLAAATHTAEVKYALRAILHEYPEPALALTRLNRYLINSHRSKAGFAQPLVAVALAIVDTETGEVAVSSAGAEYPLLLPASGAAQKILAGGMLLGIDAEEVYEAALLHLAPGDALLMVTDGLTEARQGKEFFGYPGLMRAARNALTAPGNETLGQAIITEAKHFTGGTLHDDVCLILVRRNAEPVIIPGSIVYSPGARMADAPPPSQNLLVGPGTNPVG